MTTKQKALNHYDRMIRWAKEQNPKKFVSVITMYSEIKDDWSCESCPYCNKTFLAGCEWCELFKKTENGYCCGGLWKTMNISKTWATWIKNAEKVREYIKING